MNPPRIPCPTPRRDSGGLYIHVPFCRRKCGYCDFRSEPVGAAIPQETVDRYLEGILREAELRAPLLPRVTSVFFGGGTPSLLPDAALGRILAALRDRFDVEPDAEITLEANPCDLADPERPARLAALGVTRLSVGVQSLHDPALARLGRPHGAASARAALRHARAAGLPFSADLLLGIPFAPREAFARDAAAIVALGARHLSLYALSCPEGTPLSAARAAGDFIPTDDETEATLLEEAHETLAALGLPPYEVSNFARTPADFARHNLLYWTRRPYLGLGPAAHSHLPCEERRFWNAPTLPAWLAAVEAGGAPDGEESLGPAEVALETLFLGLRHAGGVDFAALERATGLPLRERNAALLARLAADGLAAWDGIRLLPAPALLRRADGVARAFSL